MDFALFEETRCLQLGQKCNLCNIYLLMDSAAPRDLHSQLLIKRENQSQDTFSFQLTHEPTTPSSPNGDAIRYGCFSSRSIIVGVTVGLSSGPSDPTPHFTSLPIIIMNLLRVPSKSQSVVPSPLMSSDEMGQTWPHRTNSSAAGNRWTTTRKININDAKNQSCNQYPQPGSPSLGGNSLEFQ